MNRSEVLPSTTEQGIVRAGAGEYEAQFAIVLREGTPSFRTVGNHAGLFWFSMYRFSVFNGAPPAVPA